MANLITEKQKKVIKTEYWVRLFSVFLIIPTALLGLFLLAYVVPYYLSVNKKDLAVAEQFKSVIIAENKENVGESVSRAINQTTEQLKAVELYTKVNLNPSLYFDKIIANKNANIQITKLSFNFIKDNQAQLSVSGVAKNREGLVSFIDNLKAQANFATVDSPVSDFAKESDISFTINIKTSI